MDAPLAASTHLQTKPNDRLRWAFLGALHLNLREEDLPAARADCPHGVGLFDALALARKLGLPTPAEVEIIAVEAADCHTIGGAMHPAVRAAIPAGRT